MTEGKNKQSMVWKISNNFRYTLIKIKLKNVQFRVDWAVRINRTNKPIKLKIYLSTVVYYLSIMSLNIEYYYLKPVVLGVDAGTQAPYSWCILHPPGFYVIFTLLVEDKESLVEVHSCHRCLGVVVTHIPLLIVHWHVSWC